MSPKAAQTVEEIVRTIEVDNRRHRLENFYLPNIVTRYDATVNDGLPWEAFPENWEPFDPIGFGETEEEAIWDLQRQTEDDYDAAE